MKDLMNDIYANDGLVLKSDVIKELDLWATHIGNCKTYVRADAICAIAYMSTWECVEHYNYSEWKLHDDGYEDFYECDHCGKAVEDQSQFCPKCGYKMRNYKDGKKLQEYV